VDKYKTILENINDKDFENAEKICNRIKDLKNDHIALNLLGLTQVNQGKYNLAEKNFIKSSKINKIFESPIRNLFLIYLKQKNSIKMNFYANKLINLDNKNSDYNYFLGLALEFNHSYDDAIKFYKKSIELNYKEKQNAFNNIGNILLRNKRRKESIKYFKQAHELDKENHHIIFNLLANYAELRDADNLEISLNKMIFEDKNPKIFDYFKAELFILKNEIDEAKEILLKNLDDVRFSIKLIRLYFQTGAHELGKKLFLEINHKIDQDPNYINFLANTYLYEGDFKNGWRYYDKRRSKIIGKYNNIIEWTGDSLSNKKILVFSEQGLGDTIQFSKYLLPLLKISKNVTFVVQEKLINFFKKDIKGLTIKQIAGIDEKNYDFKIDLGSLIKFFYKEQINDPIRLFDLVNLNKKTELVKIKKSKLNVGIAWSGSFYGPGEPYRSLSLQDLEKLFSLDINFYCLQSEIRNIDYKYFKSLNITDCSHFDLVQVGEIINNLDLIISVDTSILHLASSFNKKTWGILNLYPDWRWSKFEKFNPYNSLKLFRQTKFNYWDDIINDIYNQLKYLIRQQEVHKFKITDNK